MWFRPDRTLQQAVAGPEADLTLMPGPKDPPERKRLRSDVLDFVFNDKGKLEELTALKDTLFTTEPIPPAKTVPRTLECKRFVAKMDPATGRATTIEFLKDVAFARGPQKATSQRALYDGSKTTLTLTEDPIVIDEEQGTELHAETIDMELRGLGVINIKDLYGVSSIRTSQRVELVVSLERWEAGREYDRLGLQDEKFLILESEMPLIRMPVAPGRNLAILVEVAARNQLLKERGYDAARQFVERVDEMIESKTTAARRPVHRRRRSRVERRRVR